VRLDKLWLTDFRSYESAELALAPGLTAILGDNGRGKSNLLEAVGWLATLESFRGAPADALVRSGAERAILRAEGRVEADGADGVDGRLALIEAELVASGRNRVQVNRQPLQRTRDLLGVLRVTVFTPDDLELVKGGPGGRRRYLDQTLVALHARYDAVRADVERVLRQRNALLRQVQGDGRRLDESAALTLDVWDAKLAEAGEELARLRVALCERLEPELVGAYEAVAVGAEARARVALRYDSGWYGRDGGLVGALAAGRRDDIRRGVSLVGPHRDDRSGSPPAPARHWCGPTGAPPIAPEAFRRPGLPGAIVAPNQTQKRPHRSLTLRCAATRWPPSRPISGREVSRRDRLLPASLRPTHHHWWRGGRELNNRLP
jgi:DNA replication and repair protein RecF